MPRWPNSVRDSGDDPETKRFLRDLDGIIPEEVNRRSFLKASLGTAAGGVLAGCTGQPSGGEPETVVKTVVKEGEKETVVKTVVKGEDKIIRSAIWRSAWKNEPSYTVAHAGEQNGFWADEDISPPSVKAGFGSGDTVKRVGTGKATTGMADIVSVLPGLDSGLDASIIGTAKARNMWLLGWNKEKMDGPYDVDDNTRIANGGHVGRLMFPIYKESTDMPDDFEAQVMSIDTTIPLFIKGEISGSFTLFHHWAKMKARADFEVGGDPLYNYLPLNGFNVLVNNAFINESGENLEFITRVLEGYSQAGKWTMLNPEKAIDMMIQEVNPTLQTVDREILLSALKAGVIAPNFTDGIKNNGFAWLNEETLQESIDTYGKKENLDLQNVSSVDDVVDWRPQENAELATFSNDEWNQIQEASSDILNTLFG